MEKRRQYLEAKLIHGTISHKCNDTNIFYKTRRLINLFGKWQGQKQEKKRQERGVDNGYLQYIICEIIITIRTIYRVS